MLALKGTDRTDGQIMSIDRVDQIRRNLSDLYQQYGDLGKLRYKADPLAFLDHLDRRNSEGRSELDHTISYHTEAHLAAALWEYLTGYFNKTSYDDCLHAVRVKQTEHWLRMQACSETLKGGHDVYCCHCKRSIMSDYHNYVCGDEDVITMDDYIGIAMRSDDPDQFIAW